LFLVFELLEEFFPIRLSLLFKESGLGLFFNNSCSNAIEEVHDFHDVFVVKLVGQLSKLGNEWLEKSGLLSAGLFLELFQDLVVSGFNLSEGNTVDHVLNELNTFFQSSDFNRRLVILFSPLGVFSVSLISALLDGSKGFIIVSLGLGEISLSVGDDVNIVIN